MPTMKESDEGDHPSKIKNISSEDVESPQILGLGGTTFRGSTCSKEDKKKTTEGGGSSRHEKAERELKRSSLALEKDATEATQTTGEEVEDFRFFVRHLDGGKLDDKEAQEIENKSEAMGYWSGALLFGGEIKCLCAYLILMNQRL